MASFVTLALPIQNNGNPHTEKRGMSTLLIALLAQSITMADPSLSYDTAYAQMESTGKPLVILVSADWCGACQTMKHGPLANLRRRGKMENVCYTVINTDQQPELAGKLMSGGTIPQLIVYRKDGSNWQRFQLTGSHSETEVETVLEQAVIKTVSTQTVQR